MPHPSGKTYSEQIDAAHKKARKNRNYEAMAYYDGVRGASASVSFETFKGSAAYESWINKPETKTAIEAAKKSIPLWGRI